MNDQPITELPGPYEILELTDREVKELRIVDWVDGTIKISTSETPAGKIVKALRVYLAPGTKTVGVNWYDITSQTLIAQMIPYLETAGFDKKTFKVTKYGTAPKARFSLEVR
jgi:hypothetical protein